MDGIAYISCEICGAGNPRFVFESRGLDGPLVECVKCGFLYVGSRRRALAFGTDNAEATTENVRAANAEFRQLRLEEERRLGELNARWRLELIRKVRSSGKLLEIGCARGEFLRVAREAFDVYGVEPNAELAESASKAAPVHRDIIERTPWSGFDVVASFHVIEHVDSPQSFIRAAAEKLKPGGLLVIETPNIDSLPYKLLRSGWRQFIPEHYFFFTPKSMERLLSHQGFTMEKTMKVGKYASMDLILNRLSRYVPWIPQLNGFSRLTFRVNPMDIMLVFATKSQSRS
jgi:2-polyprenyl-3-methyl-5-hydroxy-6-metoxy-1,4-benzoquinol methylase